MGFFGKKTSSDATPVKEVVVAKAPKLTSDFDVTNVIVRPRVTEKAALLLDKNVYTFEVKKGATKFEVRDAIKALYKVTPVSVRMVNKEPRHYMASMRGRSAMEQGLRKAYVYLKKGDRIDLV